MVHCKHQDPLMVLVPGPLHRALVGVDARGLSHASTNRRAVVCFMKRAAMSGSSFFKAMLSSLEEATGFQVIRQSRPSRVSMLWVSIWAFNSSSMLLISSASSAAPAAP